MNEMTSALARMLGAAILGVMTTTGCSASDASSEDVEANAQELTLTAQYTLWPGQSVWSDNGLYRLTMQSDCNLVLYAPNAIWSSNTWNRGGTNCKAVMQTDGNLVVYSNNGTKALWESRTWGHPGAHLDLQDDRNLVVYDKNGTVLWASDTWIRPPQGCYYAHPGCPNPPPLCVIEVCGGARTPQYCGSSCTY